MTKKKILIATGGTGGHIFPAYSFAKYLLNKDYNVKLSTDKRGFRYLKNYKELDISITTSSSIKKKNILEVFTSVFIIVYSIIRSILFLIRYRPKIIFGMGGYSSFPICIAAIILRINFIIYENNLIIGKANKYLLPFAKKLFVAHKELKGVSSKFEKKVSQIGNIVREEIINTKIPDNKQNNFDYLKILVLGGSQGAKVFAEEFPQIFKKLKNSGLQIKIYQQCLNEQNKELLNFYKTTGIECEIFNFTDKILNYYLKTNLIITRAGASVLGELINIKTPFIAIPLPSSADNHQYLNAEFYEKKGFGHLLEEKDIKIRLFDLINLIMKDKSLSKNILSKQTQNSDKDIFKNLSNQIEKIINEKN